jgi:hypothetical protein
VSVSELLFRWGAVGLDVHLLLSFMRLMVRVRHK